MFSERLRVVRSFSQVGMNGVSESAASVVSNAQMNAAQQAFYDFDIDEQLLVSVSNPEILLIKVGDQELVFIVTLSKETDKNISIHYLIVEDRPEIQQPKILQEGDLRFLPGQVQNCISVHLDHPSIHRISTFPRVAFIK